MDPERLRKQFPSLTDDDLSAYVEITRRILETPASGRPRATREVMARGRAAGEKPAAALTPEESLALRYVSAIAKMQTAKK